MNGHVSNKSTKMSFDEARSVLWPFRDIKNQPIGSLFDKHLLSYNDLAYAIHNAWDWRVREAARTVLLHAVAQENESESSPGPLHVISSERRSFAERRQFQLTFLEGSVLGFLLAVFIGLFLLLIRQPTTNREASFAEVTSSPSSIIAVIIVLAFALGAGLLISHFSGKLLDLLIFNRLDKQRQLHRKGQLGEERVLNVMQSVLDGNWWLFRNLELPGRRLGDLDFVLVGCHGVWSFEVKAYNGEFRNVGERWEKRYRGKWISISKSPTRQARRNAAELRNVSSPLDNSRRKITEQYLRLRLPRTVC